MSIDKYIRPNQLNYYVTLVILNGGRARGDKTFLTILRSRNMMVNMLSLPYQHRYIINVLVYHILKKKIRVDLTPPLSTPLIYNI